MATYTFTVVLKPDLSLESTKKFDAKVEDLVSKAGGKFSKKESLGIKPLAYNMDGNDQAIFNRFMLEIPKKHVSEIRFDLERDSDVLRVLVLSEGGKRS